MLRRLSQDIRLRPLRKRSISDSNLNRFAPSFVNNISTNIQDVLDFKSKCEYHTIEEREEEMDDELITTEEKLNNNKVTLRHRQTGSNYSSLTRSRKSGFVAIGSQVCNSLTKFVGSRMSLKRQTYQPNDPRQLIVAIRNQDINRVRYILETYPVDVNGNDSKGVTAVHEAALDGQCDMIILLLQYHAEVNKKDHEGFTCLDYAVYGGHFECAQYLIQHGAAIKSIQDGMRSSFKDNH